MPIHEIKSGDTLSRIAAQYGTTVGALAAANGIADVNKISAGARLKIPDGWDGQERREGAERRTDGRGDGFDRRQAPSTAASAPGRTFSGKTPAEGTTNENGAYPSNPPLSGQPSQRNASTYDNVINQFAVANNPRYTPKGNDTYCNIFAWDVTRAMGATLPHWVFPGGEPAEYKANGAYELNANAGHRWLNEDGAKYGWRQVSAAEAQALANQGHPTVVSYDSLSSAPGHIAVVRPGQLNANGPTIAQAGATNTNFAHVKDTFGNKPVQYWVNDKGTAATGPGAPSTTSSTANPAVLQRGQEGEAVRNWQSNLVGLGFMTQAQMDSGPGTFGPQTEASTQAFQASVGLEASGEAGPKTQAAMKKALGGGSGTTPATPTTKGPSDGSIRRWDVPYISQLNSVGSADDWNRLSNCGPATMAMITKGLGAERGVVDGDLVNRLGRSVGVGPAGIGWDGMVSMAKKAGFSAEHNAGNSVEWVKQQLKAGKLVAANGDRSVTLDNGGNPGRWGNGAGGHWITVTGMTKSGNFTVMDPSTDCRELSPAQLKRFFDARDGGGHAVAVGNGRQGNVEGGTSSPSPTHPSPTTPGRPGVTPPQMDLSQGMESEAVHNLQKSLVQLGFLTQEQVNTGPGTFGPRTLAAVKAFQSAKGVQPVSGYYGPLTRAALTQALGASAGGGSVGTGPVDGAKLSTSDAEVAAKVEAAFAGTRLKGQGAMLVAECRKKNIPIDFAMAQLWKESSFLSDPNTLSIANNNPANLRWAPWEAEFGGDQNGRGNFTKFPSIAQGLKAYVDLLDQAPYRAMVDKRDWTALVNRFCPGFDQANGQSETNLYVRQMFEWTANWQQRLGVRA